MYKCKVDYIIIIILCWTRACSVKRRLTNKILITSVWLSSPPKSSSHLKTEPHRHSLTRRPRPNTSSLFSTSDHPSTNHLPLIFYYSRLTNSTPFFTLAASASLAAPSTTKHPWLRCPLQAFWTSSECTSTVHESQKGQKPLICRSSMSGLLIPSTETPGGAGWFEVAGSLIWSNVML